MILNQSFSCCLQGRPYARLVDETRSIFNTKVMIIIWMISISATSCFLWSGEEPFSNFPEISVTPTDDGDEDEDDDDDNDIDYEKVMMITMIWMAKAERQKALEFSRLHCIDELTLIKMSKFLKSGVALPES